MLKDYYNEIIPPWDPRYGKLGHIWKWLRSNDYYDQEYYYIPYELVINIITNSRGYQITNTNKVRFDHSSNWSSATALANNLDNSCKLNIKDYYDLIVDHYNSKLPLHRCPNCHQPTDFIKISKGYNLYCSRSCNAQYTINHIDRYPNKSGVVENWYKSGWTKAHILGPKAMQSTLSRVKNKYYKFIQNATSELCILYITSDGNTIKYGATSDIDVRRSYAINMIGDIYNNPHVILKSDKITIGKYEALIGLKLDTPTEYLPYSKLHQLIDVIKSITNQDLINLDW